MGDQPAFGASRESLIHAGPLITFVSAHPVAIGRLRLVSQGKHTES